VLGFASTEPYPAGISVDRVCRQIRRCGRVGILLKLGNEIMNTHKVDLVCGESIDRTDI